MCPVQSLSDGRGYVGIVDMIGPMLWVRKSAQSCITGLRSSKKSSVRYAFRTATDGLWAKHISAAGSGTPAGRFRQGAESYAKVAIDVLSTGIRR